MYVKRLRNAVLCQFTKRASAFCAQPRTATRCWWSRSRVFFFFFHGSEAFLWLIRCLHSHEDNNTNRCIQRRCMNLEENWRTPCETETLSFSCTFSLQYNTTFVLGRLEKEWIITKNSCDWDRIFSGSKTEYIRTTSSLDMLLVYRQLVEFFHIPTKSSPSFLLI